VYEIKGEYMKKGHFNLIINRIRIDLGSEIFVDCTDACETVLLSDSNIAGLASKFKDFIEKRNGEFVEFYDKQIVIDTTDLTMYVRIESNQTVVDTKNYNLFLKLLSAG
jgi:hypothetical protein